MQGRRTARSSRCSRSRDLHAPRQCEEAVWSLWSTLAGSAEPGRATILASALRQPESAHSGAKLAVAQHCRLLDARALRDLQDSASSGLALHAALDLLHVRVYLGCNLSFEFVSHAMALWCYADVPGLGQSAANASCPARGLTTACDAAAHQEADAAAGAASLSPGQAG